jgi:hypothetical protein
MAHVPLPLQGDETQIHVDKIKLLFTDPGMFPLILDFIMWFKNLDFYSLTIFLIFRFNCRIVKQSLDNCFFIYNSRFSVLRNRNRRRVWRHEKYARLTGYVELPQGTQTLLWQK